jgi:hypothetical protein
MKKSPEKDRLRAKKYYWDHRDDVLKREKEYRRNHLEYFKRKNKELREKARFEVLTHYGGNPPRCACCGEENIKFLTIDHTKNNGYAHRKLIGEGSLRMYLWIIKNKFPKEFQILCFNCNLGRGVNKGICPHKEKVK